ncbi:hypothetical protein [Mycobacterium neglectum]|uniref:hypothetical protein n=1 Tax=Mycobacterium neglectum TaxID=242737 RepID=UPI001145869F|nr:hypothetical protein [Mycobacterium neglectum]
MRGFSVLTVRSLFTWAAVWWMADFRDRLHNGYVRIEPDPNRHAPVWRDPLSAGWRAHRGLLMLRLRWHERRDAPLNWRQAGSS